MINCTAVPPRFSEQVDQYIKQLGVVYVVCQGDVEIWTTRTFEPRLFSALPKDIIRPGEELRGDPIMYGRAGATCGANTFIITVHSTCLCSASAVCLYRYNAKSKQGRIIRCASCYRSRHHRTNDPFTDHAIIHMSGPTMLIRAVVNKYDFITRSTRILDVGQICTSCASTATTRERCVKCSQHVLIYVTTYWCITELLMVRDLVWIVYRLKDTLNYIVT